MITITNGHTVPVMLVAGMWVQVGFIPRPLPPQLLITYSMGGRPGRVSHVIYTDTDITEPVETFPPAAVKLKKLDKLQTRGRFETKLLRDRYDKRLTR